MKILTLTFFLGIFAFPDNLNAKSNNDKICTDNQPNIVFILADDLGNSDLGFAGSDFFRSPNLDKLAKESMYFDHGCASHPTCQPSRISLLTGKFPARVGAVSHGDLRKVSGTGNELPKKEVTIGKALQMGGYTTCHIGKWHAGTGENKPLNRGYDINIGSNDFCCPPTYFYPFTTTTHGDYRDKLAQIDGIDDCKEGDNLTDVLSRKAAEFIKGQNPEKPFYLSLAYYAVHTPLMGKKELVSKYKELCKSGTRHKNPTYASMIETMDAGVGTVLQAIKDAGIEDNTIVVFTSDNGGANYNGITDNYPLRAGKGASYEGGYRVPILVRWPGVTEPGSVCHERVIGYDLYPTFLTMANTMGDINHNKTIDGKDLTPLLLNANATLPQREFHFLKYLSLIHFHTPIVNRNRCVETVIKGDWKLMEFFPMPDGYKGHFELYNLKDDPSERTNLANKNPKKVSELKSSMEQWKTEIEAPRYDADAFYGEIEAGTID